MRRHFLTLSAFFIAVGIVPAVAAQEYAIKLDSTDVVGARYHLSTKATQKTKTSISGGADAPTAVEDGFEIELSADVTILETANGWATRKSFIVLDSKLTEQDQSRPLVPAGTVVLAYIQDHKTVYESRGTILDGSVTRALRGIIPLHVVGVGDDAVFGTTAKKRVGDRWSINVDGAEILLKESTMVAKREDISGFCVLKKVQDKQVFIDGTLQVANLRLDLPGYVDGGYLKSERSGRFPIIEVISARARRRLFT